VNLDKAIELHSNPGDQDDAATIQDYGDAVLLGLEALRQIKQIRVYAKELFLPLLPGETED